MYKDTNLIYLKDLWKESIHTELDSNLGVITDVEILSKKDEMHQYEDGNKIYLDFIDETGDNRKYTIVRAEHEDGELVVTVEELANPIVLYVGESLEDSNQPDDLTEYLPYNIADVFTDNVLELTNYDPEYIGLVPEDLVGAGHTYVDIDVDASPVTMTLYTEKGVHSVQKIVKDRQTKAYSVYLDSCRVIKFVPRH